MNPSASSSLLTDESWHACGFVAYKVTMQKNMRGPKRRLLIPIDMTTASTLRVPSASFTCLICGGSGGPGVGSVPADFRSPRGSLVAPRDGANSSGGPGGGSCSLVDCA